MGGTRLDHVTFPLMAISVTVLIVLSGHWWRCLSNADWFRGTDGLRRLFLEVSTSCLYRSYFNFRVGNFVKRHYLTSYQFKSDQLGRAKDFSN